MKIVKRILFLMLFLPAFAFAQSSDAGSKATKAQKKADAKKQERLMNEKKAEIEGRKQHKAIQTKEVRKRMKQSERDANRWNTGRRKFFVARWFEKKQR